MNGTWDGHIGMVLDGDAEFAVGKVSQTAIRNEYVDFMTLVTIESDSFLAQKPQLLPYSSTVYRPFTLHVWILCAVSIVAMGITFAVFKQRSFKDLKADDEILKAYSIFTVKGVSNLDRIEGRMRLIWTVWLISCLFLSLIYSSVISSYIIFPGTTAPINTLDDAVQKTDLPFVIVIYNNALINNFQDSKNPTYKKIARRLKLVFPDQVRIGLDSLYVDVRFQLELHIWRLRKLGDPVWTDLRIADQTFLALPSAWPIRKYKPYKRKMDMFIQRLHDAGLFNKWMTDGILSVGGYFPLQDVVNVATEVRHSSFGLVHVQGTFYALGFGLALASIAFGLERMFSPKRRERMRRR